MEYILDYKKSAIIAVVTAIAYRTYSKIPVPKNFEAPHTYKCRHLIIRMIMLMVNIYKLWYLFFNKINIFIVWSKSKVRVAKIFDKRAEAIIFREYVNKLVPGIQSSKVKVRKKLEINKILNFKNFRYIFETFNRINIK